MVQTHVSVSISFNTIVNLSFHTPSKHTGNDTYRALTENAVRHLAGLATPLPGMPNMMHPHSVTLLTVSIKLLLRKELTHELETSSVLSWYITNLCSVQTLIILLTSVMGWWF